MNKIFIFVCLLVVLTSSDHLYQLELLSQERGAACIDGSAPAIYKHEGSQKDKFIVYFNGGRSCSGLNLNQTLQSCYQRTFIINGTSDLLNQTLDLTQNGILSPNAQINPLFYDWTKIFVQYCDGSLFLGNNDEPIAYKDKLLYFRGSRNALQVFRYLDQNYDAYNKDTILLSGASAGASAVYSWANYVHQKTKTSQILAIPDAGLFFTDYYSPILKVQPLKLYLNPLIQLIFDEDYVPSIILQCLKNNPQFDRSDCFNAGNFGVNITVPIFIIQSLYDRYYLQNILAVGECLENKFPPYSIENCKCSISYAIQQLHQITLDYLKKLQDNLENVGFWSPSCVQHVFTVYPSFTSPNYQVQGHTLIEAIRQFINDPSNPPVYIDSKSWPNNKGCNGLN